MSIGITDSNTVDQVIKTMLTTGCPFQQLEAFCRLDEKLIGVINKLADKIEDARKNQAVVGTTLMDLDGQITSSKHVLAASMQAILSIMGVADPVEETSKILDDVTLLMFRRHRLKFLEAEKLNVAQPLEGPILPGVYRTRTGVYFRVLSTALDGHTCENETVVYLNLEPTGGFPPGQIWTIDATTFRNRFSREHKY